MAIAAAASTTGTALGMMQGSCRPVISRGVSSIAFIRTLFWQHPMDGVALMATEKSTGMQNGVDTVLKAVYAMIGGNQ